MTNVTTLGDARLRAIAREQQIEADLRDYLKRNGFQFGGVSNLCETIANLCDERAEQLGCRHFAAAGKEFHRLADQLDLPYREE